MNLRGVDFTHSTGFDKIDGSSVHEDTSIHDRYCIQTRLDEGASKGGTILCTCKIIPLPSPQLEQVG